MIFVARLLFSFSSFGLPLHPKTSRPLFDSSSTSSFPIAPRFFYEVLIESSKVCLFLPFYFLGVRSPSCALDLPFLPCLLAFFSLVGLAHPDEVFYAY